MSEQDKFNKFIEGIKHLRFSGLEIKHVEVSARTFSFLEDCVNPNALVKSKYPVIHAYGISIVSADRENNPERPPLTRSDLWLIKDALLLKVEEFEKVHDKLHAWLEKTTNWNGFD